MNISNKDLNLLLVFQMLYLEKNATKAALRLHMSQPGLSHQLQKLRDEWQDPLFIKAARGLTPTPKAHALASSVAQLVSHIEAFYATVENTDFLLREEKIVLYTTDYMEQKLLPKLLAQLQVFAPNVRIVCKNTQGKFPKDALEQGEGDIAIAGFYQDLPDTYHLQHLLTESFCVLVRKHHPAVQSGEILLEDYIRYPHIVTTLNGDLSSHIDTLLAQHHKSRKVVAGVSSFLSTAKLVQSGDWFLTCLESLAQEFCQQDEQLQSYPVPLGLDPVSIFQVWHARTHYDPLRKKIRQTIYQILSESV